MRLWGWQSIALWVCCASALTSTGVACAQTGKIGALPTERTGVTVTRDGPVDGIVGAGGIREYLGIPYAKPPVGALRWRPPEPPTRWAQTLNATKFGDGCPQTNTLLTFAAKSSTESCLFLNVFAPPANAKSGALPVMVWIYGGALIDGAATPYDPTWLVKTGTIVVTFNYRVNFLGFLAAPGLQPNKKGVANFGLLDQQAALRWVQDNIAAFGGDPHTVTIFGESAGGLSVLANLVSPGARGLFQRAIVESPANGQQLRLNQPPLSTAMDIGRKLTEEVGCTVGDAACLRRTPISKLQKLATSYTASFIVDGTTLPETFAAAFASGNFAHVPIIIGNNFDERRFPVAIGEIHAHRPASWTYVDSKLREFFPRRWKGVLKAYSPSRFIDPSVAFAAATGDAYMICPTRKFSQELAKFTTVYAYAFADRTAPMYFPPVSFPYGAVHTAEIQYLFQGYHGADGIPHTLNSLQRHLSREMVSYWTTFARSGDPNNEDSPHWPRYRTVDGKFQQFVSPSAVTVTDDQHSELHQCRFWDDTTGNADK